MKECKLFPCYSLPLRKHLTNKGIDHELVGLHPMSKQMFWVYIKNDKLNNCLRKWKEILIK